MGKKIFLIEDDRDICANLEDLLTSEGYETEVAFDGRDALDRLKGEVNLPSLIILDLMMPKLDGFEFRKEQEKDPLLTNIPVVVMTADGKIEAKSRKVRAKAFLKKPVDIYDFLAVVRQFTL